MKATAKILSMCIFCFLIIDITIYPKSIASIHSTYPYVATLVPTSTIEITCSNKTIYTGVLLYFTAYKMVIGSSTTRSAPIWFADTKYPLESVSLYDNSSYLNQSKTLYSIKAFVGEYDAYEILNMFVVIIINDIIATDTSIAFSMRSFFGFVITTTYIKIIGTTKRSTYISSVTKSYNPFVI